MFDERIPLHFLPTFVIAARLENLRATAQQVHLTHGAVSQQIQQLEQAMGCPLFERKHCNRGLAGSGALRKVRLCVSASCLLSLITG